MRQRTNGRGQRVAVWLTNAVLTLCVVAAVAGGFGCAVLWDRLQISAARSRGLEQQLLAAQSDSTRVKQLQDTLDDRRQENEQLQLALQSERDRVDLIERQRTALRPKADLESDPQGEPELEDAQTEPFDAEPPDADLAQSRLDEAQAENERLQGRLQRLTTAFNELMFERERLRARTKILEERLAEQTEGNNRPIRPVVTVRPPLSDTQGEAKFEAEKPTTAARMADNQPKRELPRRPNPKPIEDDGWRSVNPRR